MLIGRTLIFSSAVVLEELQQLMNAVVSLIASHSPQIDQAQLPTDPDATAGDVWMLGGQYVFEMWRHLGLDEGSDSPEPVVELDMRVRHGQSASDVLLRRIFFHRVDAWLLLSLLSYSKRLLSPLD
jgi:hypothetical protein